VDPKELAERRRVAEKVADSLRRAVPRITLLDAPLRHHEADGSLPVKRAGELGEDRQIGVQPDPIQSTEAERSERPFVLGASELALN
jgi:phage baseplate assembly protein W